MDRPKEQPAMDEVLFQLGTIFLDEMRERNISPIQIAEETGISVERLTHTIGKLLEGSGDAILEDIIAIAHYLGIKVDIIPSPESLRIIFEHHG